MGYYGSYSHLLRKEKELDEKAPEELTLLLFGNDQEFKISEEVYEIYPDWFYKK